jgi:hypothetical protein
MKNRPGYQNVSQQEKPFGVSGFLSTTSELYKSIKEIRLLLPQSLAAFSIMVGLLGTLSSALAPFFLSNGALFLCAGMLVSFFVVALLWLPVKRKKRRLKPEDSIQYQGRAFRLWFAGHHLSWASGSSLFIVILLVLFGPVFEVMALSAGALACTCFAVMGLFIGTKTRTLGLCWQSPVPRGVGNWWDYVGATMILRERYEYAVRHDQKRAEPVLWSISRILELASTGGAMRAIDLMDSAYPTKKTEWFHRFKVLVPLFLVTVLLAILLPKLPGLAPPTPGQVPDGWLTGIFKKSDIEDKNKNDPGEKPGAQTEEQKDTDRSSEDHKKEETQGEQGDNDQKGKHGEDADSKTEGDSGDRSNGDSGQEKGSQDESMGEGAGDDTGESKDQNTDKPSREGQGQEKQANEDKNEGEGEGEGEEKNDDKTRGSETEKDKGECKGNKNENSADRGDQDKPGKSQKGAEQGPENKPGNTKPEEDSDDSDKSKGKGKSRHWASSEHRPEMRSDPEVPLPPPGSTAMLELDLPPLDQGEVPQAEEPIDKKPPENIPGKAPDSPMITPGKRTKKTQPPPGSRASKPEQYLPNWILALLNESKKMD